MQGVCFRACTQDEASRLGVTGWVRNCADGSVEVLAEGSEQALEELAAWCHRGPPGARVFEVERRWGEPSGEFRRFSITR